MIELLHAFTYQNTTTKHLELWWQSISWVMQDSYNLPISWSHIPNSYSIIYLKCAILSEGPASWKMSQVLSHAPAAFNLDRQSQGPLVIVASLYPLSGSADYSEMSCCSAYQVANLGISLPKNRCPNYNAPAGQLQTMCLPHKVSAHDTSKQHPLTLVWMATRCLPILAHWHKRLGVSHQTQALTKLAISALSKSVPQLLLYRSKIALTLKSPFEQPK